MDEKDVNYLVKKLSLPPEIVRKLTEEERDSNLLLSAASVKNLKKYDVGTVTCQSYIKMVVLRYSYDTDFDISEKTYVSNSIYTLFPLIKRGLDYALITQKEPDERKSRYFLVLAGLLYDIAPPQIFNPSYKMVIADGFRKNSNLRSLASHVSDWIYILRDIKSRKWLENQEEIVKKV